MYTANGFPRSNDPVWLRGIFNCTLGTVPRSLWSNQLTIYYMFWKGERRGAWVVSSKMAGHWQWHVERMVWDGPGHEFTCMGAMGQDDTGPNYSTIWFRRCEWCWFSLLMMLGGQQCSTATCWVDGAGLAWQRNSISTCAMGWELVAYKCGLQRTLHPSRWFIFPVKLMVIYWPPILRCNLAWMFMLRDSVQLNSYARYLGGFPGCIQPS